jgi:hypothetical protein
MQCALYEPMPSHPLSTLVYKKMKQCTRSLHKEQIKVMHNLKMIHREKKNFQKTKEMKQCKTTILRMGKMA